MCGEIASQNTSDEALLEPQQDDTCIICLNSRITLDKLLGFINPMDKYVYTPYVEFYRVLLFLCHNRLA